MYLLSYSCLSVMACGSGHVLSFNFRMFIYNIIPFYNDVNSGYDEGTEQML